MQITLLDGSTVDTNDIVFDPSTYQFHLGDQNITSLIRFADRENNWSNFDPQTALTLQYNATNKDQISSTGTSTLGNFVDQITSDPLQAPLEFADKKITQLAGNTAKSFFGSITGWLIIGGVGLYFWLRFRK